MNKEEYIKYIENNNQLKKETEVSIDLMAILKILIEKGICTDKEFENAKSECKDDFFDISYKRLSKEELEAMKTVNSFMSMFIK